VSLGGQEIAEGDYVVAFYASANRDDTVWDRPEELDVLRPVDPMHLAFGSGPHLCLGLHLARLEARVVFEELLSRYPRWELSGEPERVSTCFANAYSVLPIRFFGL
jgi:cytochrome P450